MNEGTWIIEIEMDGTRRYYFTQVTVNDQPMITTKAKTLYHGNRNRTHRDNCRRRQPGGNFSHRSLQIESCQFVAAKSSGQTID